MKRNFFFFVRPISRRHRLVPRKHRPVCRRFLNDFYFLFLFIYLVTNPMNGAGGRLGSACRRGQRRRPGPLPPAGQPQPRRRRGSPGFAKRPRNPTATQSRKPAREVWHRPSYLRQDTRIYVYFGEEGRKKKKKEG